jgi:hypothetical protein
VGGAECTALTDMLEAFRPRIKTWAAVEERHGDGGRHWHVIAIWDKPLRKTRVDVFNVAGIHPNIKVIGRQDKDLDRVWAYIHKEEGAVHWGPWEGPIRVDESLTSKQAKWTYIVQSKDEEEFRTRVRKLDPMNHVLQHDKINGYIRQTFQEEEAEYEPEFTHFPWVPGSMARWVGGEMLKRHRPKALIIWGPTRTGKTEWARSLGSHNYFNGLFNIDDFDQNKDFIILDDVNPDFFPNYKAWIGAQKNTTLTDKYRPKRSVQWGKPCIWLSNDDPSTYKTWDWEWVRENAVVVNLTHKLYGDVDMREPEVEPELEWPETPRVQGRAESPTIYLEDIMI